MEVDIVFCGGSTGITTACSALVSSFESFRFVEEVGSVDWFQRDCLAEELGQVGAGLYVFVSQCRV